MCFNFGIYRIREQQRLKLVIIYAQNDQSLSCLYTQSTDVNEASDQNVELVFLDTSTLAFITGIWAYAIRAKISVCWPI